MRGFWRPRVTVGAVVAGRSGHARRKALLRHDHITAPANAFLRLGGLGEVAVEFARDFARWF